jgi:hypothetical protein
MGIFKDNTGYFRDGWVIVFIGLVFIVLLGSIFTGANAVTKHFTKVNCVAFSRETGRETRYAEYTYWSFDCLAKTNDGKWLPKDQLREVTD